MVCVDTASSLRQLVCEARQRVRGQLSPTPGQQRSDADCAEVEEAVQQWVIAQQQRRQQQALLDVPLDVPIVSVTQGGMRARLGAGLEGLHERPEDIAARVDVHVRCVDLD